ncbi:MAG TPA: hypothetical protein VGM44_01575 [Polyangiaceae bacterium]|jgi:hypothetical protein
MSSVSKKRATTKKKPADRRLLAKAAREERELAPQKRVETPVSDEIQRAAERAGVEPSATVAELESLREVAAAALQSFEARGLMAREWTPASILREALLCAPSDFEVIGDASDVGAGAPESMVFRRAVLRVELGIALAEHCEKFGLRTPTPFEQAEIGGAS